MLIIPKHNIADIYKIISKKLISAPIISTRLGMAHYLDCVLFDVTEMPILFSKNRALSPYFMAAELLWILSGSNELSKIQPFNQALRHYAKDGILEGAYGHRIFPHLHKILQKIHNEDNTRQAILNIFDSQFDLYENQLDKPCNVLLNFSVSYGNLSLHVVSRSSDIVFGLPYDVFNFYLLGFIIASMANKRYVGLHYYLMNVHCYEKNLNILQNTLSDVQKNNVQDYNLYWSDSFYKWLLDSYSDILSGKSFVKKGCFWDDLLQLCWNKIHNTTGNLDNPIFSRMEINFLESKKKGALHNG